MRKKCSYWSFSGPHFPAFELNTEIYKVNLRMHSECRKTWTRKSPYTVIFTQGLSQLTKKIVRFSLFHVSVVFLYSLKTTENQRYLDVFRRNRKRTLFWNGLKVLIFCQVINDNQGACYEIENCLKVKKLVALLIAYRHKLKLKTILHTLFDKTIL